MLSPWLIIRLIVTDNPQGGLDILISYRDVGKIHRRKIPDPALEVMPTNIRPDPVCIKHTGNNMRLDGVACLINDLHQTVLTLNGAGRPKRTQDQDEPENVVCPLLFQDQDEPENVVCPLLLSEKGPDTFSDL
jgi:hypothetical protein